MTDLQNHLRKSQFIIVAATMPQQTVTNKLNSSTFNNFQKGNLSQYNSL